MSQIELVIFDFDGTLVDTAPDLIRAANLFIESKGFAPYQPEVIRARIGMGLRHLILQLYPEHEMNDAFKRQIEAEFLEVYEREFLTNPQPFPGLLDFLSDWEGQIAIVSNKRERFIQPILEKLGLHRLPWVSVIGGDTFKNMKPHPEPFMAALNAAGRTPEETLVVGDGAPDVEGALAIGSLCVVPEFGYAPYSELLDLGAWKSIENYSDLLPLIRSIT